MLTPGSSINAPIGAVRGSLRSSSLMAKNPSWRSPIGVSRYAERSRSSHDSPGGGVSRLCAEVQETRPRQSKRLRSLTVEAHMPQSAS